MLNKKIIVTGGSGRFGRVLKKYSNNYYLFPTKRQLNILSLRSLRNYLKRKKPKYLIHLAGLSRPMSLHEDNPKESIMLNIIGTSNVVIACSELNIKVIYFNT